MFIMKDLLIARSETEKYMSKATPISRISRAWTYIKHGDKILIDYREDGLVPDSLKIAEEKLWEKTKRIQDKERGVYLGTVMRGDTSIEVSNLRKLDASKEYKIPTTISLYISAFTGTTGSKAPAYLIKE